MTAGGDRVGLASQDGEVQNGRQVALRPMDDEATCHLSQMSPSSCTAGVLRRSATYSLRITPCPRTPVRGLFVGGHVEEKKFWKLLDVAGILHVMPTYPYEKEHEETASCWCAPRPDREYPARLIIHNRVAQA